MAIFEVGLGLGSNIGDKAENIREALRRLAEGGAVTVKAISSLYRTAPWGKLDQDFFANAAALVTTALPPLELLDLAKQAEADMGREKGERWGPRLIDIDLLFYGDVMLDHPRLKLPHAELFNRGFVLIPLAEIAPNSHIAGRSVEEAARAMAGDGVTKWV